VPVEQAWAALPAAYEALGLTVNAFDSSAHAVGDSMTVRGKLGELPMSAVVDCGTPPAGVDPDSVDVSLFVTSRVESGQIGRVTQPSGSHVTNTVQAIARPARGGPVACRSRGAVERRLVDAVRSGALR
jgi:hypothetical protein